MKFLECWYNIHCLRSQIVPTVEFLLLFFRQVLLSGIMPHESSNAFVFRSTSEIVSVISPETFAPRNNNCPQRSQVDGGIREYDGRKCWRQNRTVWRHVSQPARRKRRRRDFSVRLLVEGAAGWVPLWQSHPGPVPTGSPPAVQRM